MSSLGFHSEGSWSTFLCSHNGEFWSSALTSDGRYLVTGGQDKTVRVWDLQTKFQVAVLEGHTSNVKGVAVSTSSKYILSGSLDKTVKLWDFQLKTLDFTFKDHQNSVFCVSISENERLGASGSQDQSIIIWDLSEKVLKYRLQGHLEGVKGVHFVNDLFLVSGAFDKTAKVWDLSTSECKTVDLGCRVMCVNAFTDKKLGICGGDEGGIKLFSLESGCLAGDLIGHTGGVRGLAVAKNVLVSSSSDKTLRMWDLDSLSLLRVFTGHSAEVNGVCLNQALNLLVSVSFDCSILIWNPEQPDPTNEILLTPYYEDSLSFHDSLVSYASHNSSLKIWNLATDSLETTFQGHNKRVTSTIFPNSQVLVSGSLDATIKIWDLEAKVLLSELVSDQGPITSISLSLNLKFLVSGSGDKTAKIWDFEAKVPLHTLSGHRSGISSVCVSGNRNRVFTASMDCSLREWNLENGSLVQELNVHKEKVWKVVLTDDQKFLVSGAYFEHVAVVDLDSGEVRARIRNAEEGVEWFARYPELRRWFLRYL